MPYLDWMRESLIWPGGREVRLLQSFGGSLPPKLPSESLLVYNQLLLCFRYTSALLPKQPICGKTGEGLRNCHVSPEVSSLSL